MENSHMPANICDGKAEPVGSRKGPKTAAGRERIRRGQLRRWQRVAMSEHNLQRAVFVHLNIRKPSGVFAFAVPNRTPRPVRIKLSTFDAGQSGAGPRVV